MHLIGHMYFFALDLHIFVLYPFVHFKILRSLAQNGKKKNFHFILLFRSQIIFNSSWPHGLQHARLLCPSLSPGICSNSCPLSQWCHPTILSSFTLFFSLQSFPASGSFPMSQFFSTGSQSIGASNISPSNEYSGLISFRIDWLDLLAVQETLPR